MQLCRMRRGVGLLLIAWSGGCLSGCIGLWNWNDNPYAYLRRMGGPEAIGAWALRDHRTAGQIDDALVVLGNNAGSEDSTHAKQAQDAIIEILLKLRQDGYRSLSVEASRGLQKDAIGSAAAHWNPLRTEATRRQFEALGSVLRDDPELLARWEKVAALEQEHQKKLLGHPMED